MTTKLQHFRRKHTKDLNQPCSQGPLSTLRLRDEPKDRYRTSAVFTKTAGHCNLPQVLPRVLPFQTDSLSWRGLGTKYNARKWTSGTPGPV